LPASLVVAGRPILQAGPNVRWQGYRNDMADVYRAVDCTVLALRYEPFGLVGVESVLCGTPVVVANNVGCAEVLRPSAGLRFELATPGSLEQALAGAVERWRAGSLRLAEPREHLGYDPSVGVHLDALLGWIGELQRSRQRG
jgi:glycosyltransferase involved in cell wall biosynthesis